MFWVKRVFVFYFLAINNKILCPYLNNLSSFGQIRTFVRLPICLFDLGLTSLSTFFSHNQVAKLIDTIEYMNGWEQSTEDPDETVQMHRLTFTFQIQ